MFRLNDPNKIVDENRLQSFRKKLDASLSHMIKSSEEGGNPFLYALVSTKEHFLIKELKNMPDWRTAATDGEKFFWHPDFIEKLNIYELQIIMQHESLHVIFQHVDRSTGKDHQLWPYCIDYVVNAHIENDFKKFNKFSKSNNKFKLWEGNLGQPISMDLFIKIMEGKRSCPKNCCFADISALHLTPEDVYKKLKPYWDASQSKCDSCGSFSLSPKGTKLKPGPYGEDDCKSCGSSEPPQPMDGHIKPKVNKQDIVEQLIKARNQANSIEQGSTPSFVEETLNELFSPSVNLSELIRMSCLQKSYSRGSKNNWKRPKRRSVSIGQYMPSRKSFKPKWLAMIDTSASMLQSDITYGLSQLQSLGYETDGLVVPCDAKVYWENATEIKELDDLKQTSIIGRGGTTFIEFFKDFPEKVGTEFDVVVIITDGLCGNIPIELAPPIDTIWVITNKNTGFNPSFGRVVKLNG